MKDPQARWWEARRSQNSKPSTYRCPLCGELLPALSAHMLLFPEGDHSRRRHAHAACVMKARAAGALPTRSEWEGARRGGADSSNIAVGPGADSSQMSVRPGADSSQMSVRPGAGVLASLVATLRRWRRR